MLPRYCRDFIFEKQIRSRMAFLAVIPRIAMAVFWSTRALQPRRDARGLMDESGKVHVDKRSSKKKRFIY